MERAARQQLLPGVAETAAPPNVVFRSQPVIRRARRRAMLRDTVDLFLLAGVDGLFLHWPRAHVPAFDRGDSMLLLAAVNAAMIAAIWLARALPRWTARRVASTWCPAERSRLVRR